MLYDNAKVTGWHSGYPDANALLDPLTLRLSSVLPPFLATTLATDKPLGVAGVVNPLRASGGADPDRLEQARRNAVQALNDIDWAAKGKTVSVRINGLDTHYMYRDVVDYFKRADVKVVNMSWRSCNNPSTGF